MVFEKSEGLFGGCGGVEAANEGAFEITASVARVVYTRGDTFFRFASHARRTLRS